MEKVRTLLADDHALVRSGLRNALSELPNIQIIGEVGNGRDLIDALKKLRPDCLLIDVTMPDFEPLAAIQYIRMEYPNMRILVVSAYDDDVYVQGLLSAGVDGYHLKDQPLSDLRLAVQRVLAGERWISSSLVNKLLAPQRTPSGSTPIISSRQKEILVLLTDGLDNKAIARRLGLSIKTIENHLTRLYRQINVHSRLEAANYVRDHPECVDGKRNARVQEDFFIPSSTEQIVILLLDDNQRYRGQLRQIIGRVYPQALIYEADDIESAIHVTNKVMPTIVFIDVVLGDEDGIRGMRKIKFASPATRAVLISAYPDREFHRRGLEAGAIAFLDKKDLDASTLYQIIIDNIV